MESVNVKVDEYIELHEFEYKEEPKDYKTFIYYYEGILKDNRKGKLDAKSEEGILLGYSTRSKAYKCLITNTNKIVESANVKVDEYSELHEVEHKEESKNYRTFI